MKLLTGLLTLSMSLSAFAFEQTAKLDFTNLYGNFNAGVYEATVKLFPKTSLSKASIQTSLERDDNDLTCVTTARFEVGEMTFKVLSADKKWQKVSTEKIYGTVSHSVFGESTCDLSLENLAGLKNLYIQVSVKGMPLTLPVTAPAGYDKVTAWLIPFTGYLYSAANIEIVNDTLVVDPSELLTKENIYPLNDNNASKFYYYVNAMKENTSLSLANGVVNF